MLTKDRVGGALAIVAAIVGLVLVFSTREPADDDDPVVQSPSSQVAPAPGQPAPAPGGQVGPAPAAPGQVAPAPAQPGGDADGDDDDGDDDDDG